MRKFCICLFVCLSLILPVSATNETETSGDGVEVSAPGDSPEVIEEVLPDGGDFVPTDVPEIVVVSPEEVSLPDPEASQTVEEGDLSDPDVPSSVVVSADDPIPVTVIEVEDPFPAVYASGDPLDLQIEDVPPDIPPFYGSLYITGETSSGQTVTLYFPTTYKEGYFGVDSTGRLFNVSASSITGYYSGAYNNSINLPAWSYPRYRTSSSSYDYVDLYIVPQYSNIDIATGMEGRTTFQELVPYFSLLMLGVIYLCCLKRS